MEHRALAWDNLVPDHWLSLCPNFQSFCRRSLVAFGEFIFQTLLTNQNQLFEFENCKVRHIKFPAPWVYQHRVFITLVGPSGTRKSKPFYISLTNAPFRSNEGSTFFSSTLAKTVQCFAKTDWKSIVCSMRKLEVLDSLKHNGQGVLLIFDNSYVEICISKTIVDISTAGRLRGLSTI